MTRSNKTPKNPAKSRIKSLKSVTPQKRTWRKWHNQPAWLARQAADERRHDRLLGRFDIIRHVTTTRYNFVSPFLFQLPLLSTCNHWPVTSTCHHQPVISSVISSVPPCSPSPQSALQPVYQPVIVIVYLVYYFACCITLIIALLSTHHCIDKTRC